jgi:hypothetical protein
MGMVIGIGHLLTIASPLSKEGSKAVAHKTVPGSPIFEERTVIPPAFVGTVEFQVSLILPHLELHPLALRVAISMVLRKVGFGLVNLAVGIKPTWRFW